MRGIPEALIEAFNRQDLDRLVQFYAADFQGEDPAEAHLEQGPAGLRLSVTTYWQAFPDLRLTQEHCLVQGSQVALFWHARGTHRGPLLHIPPTGRTVSVRGVSLLTLHEGLIVHCRRLWDVAGMLRALRLLPELA
jgi:steroid delta-isomerase-like uncharacterized protein